MIKTAEFLGMDELDIIDLINKSFLIDIKSTYDKYYKNTGIKPPKDFKIPANFLLPGSMQIAENSNYASKIMAEELKKLYQFIIHELR